MEKRAPKTKRSPKRMARTPNPKNPGNSRTGQAKQKIALTRRSLRGLRPQKKEPVQLVEMPPIPLSETSPQGIKRECKTRHSKIKGRGPKKAIRHSKFKTHKNTGPSIFNETQMQDQKMSPQYVNLHMPNTRPGRGRMHFHSRDASPPRGRKTPG